MQVRNKKTIGRGRYIGYVLGPLAIVFVAVLIFPHAQQSVFLLMMLAAFVPMFVGTYRRLNDLGMNELFMILLFIPCINCLLVFYLFLAPGKVMEI